MDMARRVLLLELNELTPTLMDRFIDEGHLPAFARLRDESVAYVTDAEEDQGHLNPWIQWPTVHTGASFSAHGVFKLGEGSTLSLPTITDVVRAAGRRSWICGAMNVPVRTDALTWWLPDPWAPDASSNPASFDAFLQFVRANVQEHSNVAHRQSLGDGARFVGFMVRHGLKPSTTARLARQLVGERTRRAQRWERAAVLDRLQWDLFEWAWRRHQPDFATYFSNSTAHFQHLYWRYLEPEEFTLRATLEDQARFGDAILAGYRYMDGLVSRAVELAGDDATIVLCTALGQQPFRHMDEVGGKRAHRPYRVADLTAALGIEGVVEVAPVMAEQFHLYFADEPAAARAADVLESARVGGDAAFSVRRNGVDVLTGCALLGEVAADATIVVPDTKRTVRFHDVLYQLETAKSGYHHPHGLFWIRSGGAGRRVDEPVPLRAVGPTVLDLLGLTPPATMRLRPLATSADQTTSPGSATNH
jgi:hypothetical protein